MYESYGLDFYGSLSMVVEVRVIVLIAWQWIWRDDDSVSSEGDIKWRSLSYSNVQGQQPRVWSHQRTGGLCTRTHV